MARTADIEVERRIRSVQEWIIADRADVDIISACIANWGVSKRQAQRYIKTAGERWKEQNEKSIHIKRATRIQATKKLINNITPELLKTPAGFNAVIRAYKFLDRLEGTTPTKQEIEAQIAMDQDEVFDPLSTKESVLKIELTPAYEDPQAVRATGQKPE